MSVEITERVLNLASKLKQQKGAIETEEATKNAFVMPFLSMVLGYDVFNPNEVVPEFTADVGTKRGEKVDYAITRDGEVQILVECKTIGAPLSLNHASQLFRYFAVTSARIAVLTNGDEYRFYTDLDAPNKMDEKPFLVVKISDFDEALSPELKKLTREDFDLESILSSAEELKYVGELKRALAAQFLAPDADWVRMLTTKVYSGSITQKVRDQFTGLVVKASNQFLNDRVNDRLRAALRGASELSEAEEEIQDLVGSGPSAGVAPDSDDKPRDGIETTLEEVEGFQILRAIACSEVPPTRIAHRDNKSYFGVLLDDNNRKPIARLWFNGGQKYLGLFDREKNETRHPIASLEEIYLHAEHIRETVHYYD